MQHAGWFTPSYLHPQWTLWSIRMSPTSHRPVLTRQQVVQPTYIHLPIDHPPHPPNPLWRSENVVEELHYKSLSLLSIRELLREQISFIVIGINVGSAPFTSGYTLSDKMICNALGLLFQSRIRSCGICQHRLVVSVDVCRTHTWYPHHPQLVSETSEVLTTLFHCNKFGAKGWWLHGGLLLAPPIYQCTV